MEEIRFAERIEQIVQEIAQLRDLFVRRLADDKVRARSVELLSDQINVVNRLLEERFLETLFRELLLVCDRIEATKEKSAFLWSIYDEILEVFARRDVVQIDELASFNPQIHKAIGTVPVSEDQLPNSIFSIVRNGYMLRDRILRPAEVIVAVVQSEIDCCL